MFPMTTQFYTGYAPPDPVIESTEVARIGSELGDRYEVLG